MATTTVLLDLHYLPSLEYFACLWPYDVVRLEAHGSYQKQTYYNRCYIRASQQVDRLTVPVVHQSTRQQYQQVAIDYAQPWVDIHWRALCTAYNKAPFFEYFAECFYAVYKQQHSHLFELNLALLKTCLKLLQLDKQVVLSSAYEWVPTGDVFDARATMLPRQRTAPSHYYRPTPYPQVFGQTFSPNLSIIDLLCCEGHCAVDILRQSVAEGWRHQSSA